MLFLHQFGQEQVEIATAPDVGDELFAVERDPVRDMPFVFCTFAPWSIGR